MTLCGSRRSDDERLDDATTEEERQFSNSAQLFMRLAHEGPALIVRAHTDQRNLRAECDWTRVQDRYESSNGWTVKRAWMGRERHGWAAFAPDGLAEWWSLDPVTAMVRAEGGS